MRRLIFVLLVSVAVAPVAPVEAVTLDGFRSVADVAKSPRSIGQLIIPRLGVNTNIYVGITNREFDLGVGKWPGTPSAGRVGNLVIGGHRTKGARPFYNIEKLRRGDIITVVEGQKRARYAVEKQLIVSPTAMWITNQSSKSILTLFACHPKGSTKERYVIRTTLVK